MGTPNRRNVLQLGVAIAGGAALGSRRSWAEAGARRKFKMNLNVGQVGVKADPFEAIKLAKKYGYEAVTPMAGAIQRYSSDERQRLLEQMQSNGLVWGATGIGPFFDRDDATFNAKLEKIAATARMFQEIGVTRCFTWTMSSSETLTYRQNFEVHARRLRRVGEVLGDHDVRLGIEYLGTADLVIRNRFPWMRTSTEAKELLAEVDLPNIGVALDAWHWFHASEGEQDILKLTDREVVTADICDAPAGIEPKRMPDSPRTLPCVTGVIDVAAFLRGLVKIGYDGPVGTEPFDKTLRTLSTDQAMTKAAAAMNKAFALIE